MAKRYMIVDDSGVDYDFLHGFGKEKRWLNEIVEGSDEPLNGCLTVKQPFGPGTWTAPVECFQEVKDEPCVTGPDEYLSKLDAAQDFVDHLRKRFGYGALVGAGQLETLANVLDEAEVQVRSLWRRFNPLTAEEFAELHSLEMDYMHLVDPMGNQAENLFSAEKHFGVFDPDCSRPRWRVYMDRVGTDRNAVIMRKLESVTFEELRRALTKFHSFSKAQALQIVNDHVASGNETLDIWGKFNKSVTSYKVVQ